MSQCMAKQTGFYGGCLRKPGALFNADKCPEWAVEVGEEGESSLDIVTIKDALLQLRRDDDSQWNKNGMPKVSVVSEITGYKVTKADIESTWPGFHRDMLKHGAKSSDGSIVGA